MNTKTKSSHISIGYLPEIKTAITKLHYDYYREKYHFDGYFKSMVSQKLDSFFNDYTVNRDCIWTLHVNKKIEGSILIDGSEKKLLGAHLLLFFVSGHYRCIGYGTQLLNNAISFCKKHDFPKIYLRTFKGLDAARQLYEKNGFKMTNEARGNRWGRIMIEQKFELILKG